MLEVLWIRHVADDEKSKKEYVLIILKTTMEILQ